MRSLAQTFLMSNRCGSTFYLNATEIGQTENAMKSLVLDNQNTFHVKPT